MGGQEGGLGGHFGPQALNSHVTVMDIFYQLVVRYDRLVVKSGVDVAGN